MSRTRLMALVLVTTMVLAVGSSAVSAQTLPIEVPGLGEVTAIEDLLDIGGLDLDDPILETVTGVVTSVVERITTTLVDTPLPNTLALQGDDAIDAAIAFSQATYDQADTILLARDDLFADALTTGALQGIVDAPLLLTTSGDLDRRVAGEIIRLRASRVLVLGGEAAINPLVLQKLDIAGFDVDRIGGDSRVETAALAAAQTAPDATTAVLTRAYSTTLDDSQTYADLLAVSPWAAQNDWPVLLTQTEVLTATVRQHIAQSALTEVVIIGGTAAVSQSVQDELVGMGLTVRRVSGATRFATAVAIAEERGFADSGDASHLVLAEGTAVRDDVWAPGFAAAAYASQNDAPVLLTSGATLPAETLAFLTQGMADNLTDGGPAALCATFVDPVACEAAGLLLAGHLSEVLTLLDLQLTDIPFIEQLLRDIGLGDLADLLDALDGVVDGIISGVAAGDLAAIIDALTGAVGTIVGIVEGVIGSDIDPDLPPTPIDGVVDEVVDVVDGVPVDLPTETPVDGVVGGVDGVVGGVDGVVGGVDGVVDGGVGGVVAGVGDLLGG